MKEHVTEINLKDKKKLIAKLRTGGKPHYVKSFLIGMSYYNSKDYRNAVMWFARSYYYTQGRPKKPYPLIIYRYIFSLKKVLYRKSPLAREALYYLSLSYLHLNETRYALKFLAALEGALDAFPLENYLGLKAQLYSQKQPRQAIRVYRKLITLFPKPTYHIRLAHLYDSNKQYQKALKHYFKVFYFHHVRWAHKTAAKQIHKIISKHTKNLNFLDVAGKILYAESLRYLASFHKAKKILSGIQLNKIKNEKIKLFYIKSYVAIALQRREYKSGIKYANRHLKAFPEDKKFDILLYWANYLMGKKKYKYVLRLIPKFINHQKLMLIRIKALYKEEVASREIESAYYLENFDRDSIITERCFFSKCLQLLMDKNWDASKKCLSKLVLATKNVAVGGRSRYFLAKLYEKSNQQKAYEFYKKSYLNSPSDYYSLKALRKIPIANTKLPTKNNIHLIRDWLANNAGDTNNIAKFFHRKRTSKGYGVDPFWSRWESQLQETGNISDPMIRKAILFIAMGYKKLASFYYKGKSKLDINLYYQRAGELTGDVYLRLSSLQHYLIIHKKSPDIFTLSKKAQQILYPLPYRHYVERASKKFNLPLAFIYAVMKQESTFRTYAVSSAGAVGLMQIMPSTGRYINKSVKLRRLNLRNPWHSILIGAKFFSQLYEKTNSFEKSAIAYNAGPSRLAKWEKKIFTDHETDIIYELIPFRETRVYVKKTGHYFDAYSILLKQSF